MGKQSSASVQANVASPAGDPRKRSSVPKSAESDVSGEAGDSKPRPRFADFAERGIRSGSDFAGGMGALMSDLWFGLIDPRTSNAIVNAGGRMLKVVEMQYKYGRAAEDNSGHKHLDLVLDTPRDLTPNPKEVEKEALLKRLAELDAAV